MSSGGIFRPGRGMNYFMVLILLACIVAILIVLIRIFKSVLSFTLLEGLLI